MNTFESKEIGKIGENIAKEYLIKLGYHVLTQNYHQRGAEIDLICKKSHTLHFIEVKTRSSQNFGTPEEGFHRQQLYRIKKAAQKFLSENKMAFMNLQFDLLAIELEQQKAKIKFYQNL
ncbi:YraN family protein [Candidatus Peregrinibacteria bacterium]|nr:YraN family protein [Candidatus Peregrinibacteria bacterium]